MFIIPETVVLREDLVVDGVTIFSKGEEVSVAGAVTHPEFTEYKIITDEESNTGVWVSIPILRQGMIAKYESIDLDVELDTFDQSNAQWIVYPVNTKERGKLNMRRVYNHELKKINHIKVATTNDAVDSEIDAMSISSQAKDVLKKSIGDYFHNKQKSIVSYV